MLLFSRVGAEILPSCTNSGCMAENLNFNEPNFIDKILDAHELDSSLTRLLDVGKSNNYKPCFFSCGNTARNLEARKD